MGKTGSKKQEVLDGRKRFHELETCRSDGKRKQFKSYDRKSPFGGLSILGGMEVYQSKFILNVMTDLVSNTVVLLGDSRLSTEETQKYLSEYYNYKRSKSGCSSSEKS